MNSKTRRVHGEWHEKRVYFGKSKNWRLWTYLGVLLRKRTSWLDVGFRLCGLYLGFLFSLQPVRDNGNRSRHTSTGVVCRRRPMAFSCKSKTFLITRSARIKHIDVPPKLSLSGQRGLAATRLGRRLCPFSMRTEQTSVVGTCVYERLRVWNTERFAPGNRDHARFSHGSLEPRYQP